ncbi:MAG: hypothetical protein Q7T26_00485 [Dehalococcoidia bacterium]|nr:hypothetical protein [Dehalococcoidia bacterium]
MEQLDGGINSLQGKFSERVNMFCVKCLTPLPDSANYCLNCGEHTKAGGAQELGRWKYQEFSAKLDGREYEATGVPIDGSIPWPDAMSSIGHAVQKLVNRVGSDGWQPVEPIEVDRLWRSKRISGTSRDGSLLAWNPKIYWRPHEVRINFRRWVSGGATVEVVSIPYYGYIRHPVSGKQYAITRDGNGPILRAAGPLEDSKTGGPAAELLATWKGDTTALGLWLQREIDRGRQR